VAGEASEGREESAVGAFVSTAIAEETAMAPTIKGVKIPWSLDRLADVECMRILIGDAWSISEM
jgi:hypothetical protein